MTARVLVIGDIVTDILAVHSGPLAVDSDTPARITITAGGAAANTAAWLAHAGATVELLAVVGSDPAGEERVAELTRSGVGCSRVRRSQTAPTGTIIVLTDGRARTMVPDRGANHDLRPSDVDGAFAALPGVVHLHLSGYTLLSPTACAAGLRALELARANGASTSVDAASAEPLRAAGSGQFLTWVGGTDLLLANLDEARVLAGTDDGDPIAVARALARTVTEVVVKLGPGGAVWASGDEVRAVPAQPVLAVDTTGAGDAFAAGLIAARVAGWDLEAALAQAVRLATQAVTIVGGRPAA